MRVGHPKIDVRHRRTGVTLVEVLVVILILVVLAGILIPVVSRARATAQRTTCISNLHQIAQAFHMFANHDGGLLPDPTVTQVSWETSLLPFTTSKVFQCPADGEIYPSVGSSYDWRDTADATTTLAGQSISSPARSSLILTFEALPGWHAKDRICAARLDGAAMEMDYTECMKDLEIPNVQTQPSGQNQ
jgi:prepilin-type N-terminal cleavage/methylation domain-containing protein